MNNTVCGVSPLYLACQRGNHIAVSSLLKCNSINVWMQDKNRNNPLHEASRNGHHAIVGMLIKHVKLKNSEDVEKYVIARNNVFHTPLHLACREGHNEVVKIFFNYISDKKKRVSLIEAQDNEDSTPLQLASKNGHGEIVRLMALNIDHVSGSRRSFMHVTASYGYKEAAKILSEPNVNVVDGFDQTPLHYAAKNNQVEMIEFLINQ